jgi:hypothetical protein
MNAKAKGQSVKGKARTGATQEFTATLNGGGPGSAWTSLQVPGAASAAVGKRGRMSVCGSINGFRVRSSIFPNGKGGHHMMVNKAMRDGAKAEQGDSVTVTMAVDNAPREVAVPPDLAKAFKGKSSVRKFFDGLSPSCRKEYADWIESAKREETRKARVEKALAMLAAGRKRVDD